jgi:hypothetical protein
VLRRCLRGPVETACRLDEPDAAGADGVDHAQDLCADGDVHAKLRHRYVQAAILDEEGHAPVPNQGLDVEIEMLCQPIDLPRDQCRADVVLEQQTGGALQKKEIRAGHALAHVRCPDVPPGMAPRLCRTGRPATRGTPPDPHRRTAVITVPSS